MITGTINFHEVSRLNESVFEIKSCIITKLIIRRLKTNIKKNEMLCGPYNTTSNLKKTYMNGTCRRNIITLYMYTDRRNTI